MVNKGKITKKMTGKMQDKKETRIKEKNLRQSVVEGSANAVKLGFLDPYISPFAIMFGAGSIAIGLLTSLPLFLGSIAQLFSAKIAEFFGSRRMIMSKAAFLQALMAIPIVFLPFMFREYAVLIIIIFYSLYNIIGNLISPVWDSWISDIVDEEKRGRYFGMRNKFVGAANFIAGIIAGAMLSYLSKINAFAAFGIIFGIAMAARIFSSSLLSKVYDPPFCPRESEKFSFLQFLGRMKDTNYGKFVVYQSLMRFAVYIAAPFFTLFMLRELGFSYFEYMLAVGANLLATFLTMLYWGKYIDFFGNKKILSITGIMVSVIPLLWVFSGNLVYIIIIQVFSGFVWAGQNLSTTTFIYDAVKPKKRIRAIAYFSAICGTATLLGSLAGGFIADATIISGILKYDMYAVFIISFILRLLVAIGHTPLIQEEKKSFEQVDTKILFIDIFAVRPIHIFVETTKTTMNNARRTIGRVKDYYNNHNKKKQSQ